MTGTLFTFTAIGLVLGLSAHEYLRYRREPGPEEEPYPRKRLVRRLGASLLAVGVLLMLRYKPEDRGPRFDLTYYAGCLAAMILFFILTVRDLGETSRMVVREHGKLMKQAEDQIAGAAERAKRPRPPSKRV